MKLHYSPDEIISIITYSGVNIDGERYYMNEDEFGNTLFQAKLGHHDNETVSVKHKLSLIYFQFVSYMVIRLKLILKLMRIFIIPTYLYGIII